MIRAVPITRAIHASAPIRICDIGGWTDTWIARHGKVFNIAVRPPVYARVDVFGARTREARVIVNAGNYALRYSPPLEGAWGPHPVIEAALRAMPPPGDVDVEVTVRSKAPAGASTGTSAAVAVALLGALDRLGNGARAPYEIATLAHAVETKWLGRQSGVQDQLCSAHGGVNFIDITHYPTAAVHPLALGAAFIQTLQRRMALISLGRSHSSWDVHEKVMRKLEPLGPDCPPLQTLRAAAEQARDAALTGDFVALGLAMRRNTEAQASLHEDLIHPDAWRVIDIAAAHGALGWKVNGAGGDGGSLTILCDDRPAARREMVSAIRGDNPAFAPIPHVISRHGLRVCDR
jgi:D-glycero-alpha-D-manno-heptose-7-phosphate kinase